MSILDYTPLDKLQGIYDTAVNAFKSRKTQSIAWRKLQLQQLHNLLEENSDAFEDALYKDLRKPTVEISIAEVLPLCQEIQFVIKNLDSWAKPQSVKTPLPFKMSTAQIRSQPRGTVFVIGAWNYPVTLLVGPLIGAIAAGNTFIAKPSEVSPHTAQLLGELFPKYLDKEAFHIVNGSVSETTKLLEFRWDLIFYTGNGTVGRTIASAAAKHLTPIVLELGGKSPAVISKDTNVDITARRLAWGKFYNNGQTCIAPDYVMVEEPIKEAFVHALQKYLKEFYGENPQKSESYGRIVNEKHFKRVTALVAQTKGQPLNYETDATDNYISPTIVDNVGFEDKLMEEEIFGPILPIISIKNVDEAIDYINTKDQPLTLHVFSKDKRVIEKVSSHTRSGSLIANDCLAQGLLITLPFGGVGQSGVGSYHGKFTFHTFSHQRSWISQPFFVEKALELRYAPYTPSKLKILKAFISGRLPFNVSPVAKVTKAVIIAMLAVFVYKKDLISLLFSSK